GFCYSARPSPSPPAFSGNRVAMDDRSLAEIDCPSGGPGTSRLPVAAPLRLLLRGSSYVVQVTQPEATLGRHSGCDVRLPLPDISRHHCSFTYENGSWFVMDLQSTNGTYVNGTGVNRAQLKNSDLLSIGGFKFDVQLGELPQAASVQDRPDQFEVVRFPTTLADPEAARRKAS